MMFLTRRISPSPLFSSFRSTKKLSPEFKNLIQITTSFDENLLRGLKTLTSASDPHSITLSWLSLAVHFLSSTHASAQALVSDFKFDDSNDRYLDWTAKLLDICNSIFSEIDRLKQYRLRVNFALYQISKKLDGAAKSLPDLEIHSVRKSRASLDVLIRGLTSDLTILPCGKITCPGRLADRTFYAVGSVTIFVFAVLTSALIGPFGDPMHIPATSQFLWSDSFNSLRKTIDDEVTRHAGKEPFLKELADVDSGVHNLRDAIVNGRTDALDNAVNEVETAMEMFSMGLEDLCEGVNGAFQDFEGVCSQIRYHHFAPSIYVMQSRNFRMRKLHKEFLMLPPSLDPSVILTTQHPIFGEVEFVLDEVDANKFEDVDSGGC